MIDTPYVTQTEAQLAAVIDLDVPRSGMMAAFGDAVRELLAALAAQGIKPMSSVYAHHLKMRPDRFIFELGFVTGRPVEAISRVRAGMLPACRAACTIYHGPYDGLPQAWGRFDVWMKAQGLKHAENLWEVYTYGPQSDPDPRAWWTELVRPLAPA